MPEIKNLFTSGKMNKDLDERIIPNNQYRDALNIQVSHSEGSDVGAIQNILGNSSKINNSYNPSTNIHTQWNLNAGDINYYGFENAQTIGVIKYDKTEKIYWIVKADNQDGILEYDQSTDVVSPILIDKNNILNLSTNNLITGINIIDGLLFFTDDLNEPKCINIERFKSATALSGNTSHTEIYGRDFIEQDITVIKKSPLTAPSIEVKDSKREGAGTGINFITYTKNFTQLVDGGPEYESLPVGNTFTVSLYEEPNWQIGDTIKFSTNYSPTTGSLEQFDIYVNITASSSSNTFTLKILTIPDNLPNESLVWELVLKEEEPIFEKTFSRFAYRWKYEDNEYSVFSPFTKVAFSPGYFKYLSSDGYNKGMENNTRYIRVYGLETPPPNVTEIEILYKNTSSNNIYTVDTVPLDNQEIEINSELIYKVIEGNQIFRPWDNVPRKAKSQEIIANRLIYANYLQNYNVPNDLSLDFYNSSQTHPTLDLAKESVKSLRTYQLGVVWKDKYGRETPVFTTSNATLKIGSDLSNKINKLTAKINSNPPSFATHFKYFIKDISNPYYNLALDRFYFAEDGNIWLSFPSSERNKVDEETYLYLKKKHDSSEIAPEVLKYKILDISNEAPEFIATKKFAVARAECDLEVSNKPGENVVSFFFKGPDYSRNPSFAEAFKAPNLLKVQSVTGSDSSLLYDIKSGGPTGEGSGNDAEYKVTLKEPMGSDASWVDDLTIGAGKEIEIVVYENKVQKRAEFEGRFFVKINRDANITTNIIDAFGSVDPEYVVVNSTEIKYTITNTGRGSSYIDAGWRDNNADSWSRTRGEFNIGRPVSGAKKFAVGVAAFGGRSNPNETSIPLLDDYLSKTGTFIRFKDTSTGNLSEVYTISEVAVTSQRRYSRNGATSLSSNWRKQVIVTLDRELEYGLDIGNSTSSHDFIQVLQERTEEDYDVLSSNNPCVFETEPKESAELDIYYEASDAIAVSNAANDYELSWFNCYSFGNGVESNRISDDFNAPTIDKGVKVSAVLDEPYGEERRDNGFIFSQIFNSTSGVNRLNQFIQALPITKDLNPIYGSIQKLHARDTDLIALCEDKVLKLLANKDALFNADGNANVTSNNAVLGQAVPYIGEYGISKNPESFVSYGFRAFFSDKNRGVVLRLSRNGLEEISGQGMSDYFSDKLKSATNVIGSYDDYSNCYNISFSDETVSYKQGLEGWPTRKSFVPEMGISLNNVYYTFKNGVIWSHDNETRNNFYGTQYKSSVKLIFNSDPSSVKNFKTLGYEGDEGWTTPNIQTNMQNGKVPSYIEKEGMYYNFIKGEENTWDNNTQIGTLDTNEFSTQGIDILDSITGDPKTQYILTVRENND